MKSWGTPGTGPGQFNLPHTIAIDNNDNIYVGDRTNRRIQVFDTDGKFLRMFAIDVPPVPGIPAVNGNTPTSERLSCIGNIRATGMGTVGPDRVPVGVSYENLLFDGGHTYSDSVARRDSDWFAG